MFIHRQSDTDTYNYFFGRLASKLQDMDFQQLCLRLDDEFAMRKSLAFSFGGAALLACTQYLKRNTEHYARESMGLSSSQRNHFVHTIFGDAGLTSWSDVASLDAAVDRFRSGLLADVPDQLRQYFNRESVHSNPPFIAVIWNKLLACISCEIRLKVVVVFFCHLLTN